MTTQLLFLNFRFLVTFTTDYAFEYEGFRMFFTIGNSSDATTTSEKRKF